VVLYVAKRNMYRLPPAGGFPSLTALIKTSLLGLGSSLAPRNRLTQALGAKQVFVNSGKSALFVSFLALARLKSERTIAMPSYTC
jgi:hypothetical protein